MNLTTYRHSYHRDDAQVPHGVVFVFGSNTAGRHGAGAALFAYDQRDAKLGKGEGRTALTYAIPTKDAQLKTRSLPEIKEAVDRFITHAKSCPNTRFYVTRVGCGLAGYQDADIAPLFRDAPLNCNFALPWQRFIEGD